MPSEGSPRPGDLKFADLSGPDGKPDGKIDLDYDRTIIGDPFPDVSMSLNLNWGWKGIDFNMFWQTVLGRDMYNQGRWSCRSTTTTATSGKTGRQALDGRQSRPTATRA